MQAVVLHTVLFVFSLRVLIIIMYCYTVSAYVIVTCSVVTITIIVILATTTVAASMQRILYCRSARPRTNKVEPQQELPMMINYEEDDAPLAPVWWMWMTSAGAVVVVVYCS